MPEISIARNDEASRYEIRSDGTLAGFAEFELRPSLIAFTHTVVDPAFQGQGLASRLAAYALADAVASGDTIIPYCPYIEKYLRTHEIAGAKVRWPEPPER
ncbi:putative GNAT family acetyltransferase [Microbacterium resistens]|uniref:GNAT family acetyltransferase n=1 Tax=Microbacterium resistens TaxID=156977 RepID=A0ABU1SA87_9MICO|nr:GNAT family N-acetyltransferase [Microbacterium resistens]MDR6866522.1 putative GNAT family acetyltransferase [Microbacterium resistens]